MHMDGDEQKQKQIDPSAANDSTISLKNRIDRKIGHAGFEPIITKPQKMVY